MIPFLNILWNFFIINNFGASTTLLAGLVAYFIYKSQKKDEKTNAAKMVSSEIRLAEGNIEIVRDLLRRGQKDFPRVLPINSWDKYSYLFVSDFDEGQIDEINSFYNICKAMDDAVIKDDEYFWQNANSIGQEGQRMATKVLYDSLSKDLKIDAKKLSKYKKNLLDVIPAHPFMYSPQKTINILTASMAEYRKITTTVIGQKIKDIAAGKRVKK